MEAGRRQGGSWGNGKEGELGYITANSAGEEEIPAFNPIFCSFSPFFQHFHSFSGKAQKSSLLIFPQNSPLELTTPGAAEDALEALFRHSQL